jgi:NHL repeat
VAAAVTEAGLMPDEHNVVFQLPTEGRLPTELPFTDLNHPVGVAVDASGTVYVADQGNNRVLKLPAGAPAATELPLTGLNKPVGVAVDSRGNVYLTHMDLSIPYYGSQLPDLAASAPGGPVTRDPDPDPDFRLPATPQGPPPPLPVPDLPVPWPVLPAPEAGQGVVIKLPAQ